MFFKLNAVGLSCRLMQNYYETYCLFLFVLLVVCKKRVHGNFHAPVNLTSLFNLT